MRSKYASIANSAALALSVSKTVSTSSRSTPPSTRPSIASVYAATSSSKLTLRNPGSLTSGEIVAVRLVGPSAPATKRGLSGVFAVQASAHSRAIRAAARLISRTCLRARSRPARSRRVEGVGLDDVGAGLEERVVDLADDVGLGQHQQVVVALQVVRVIAAARTPSRRDSRPRRACQPGSSCPSRRRGSGCARRAGVAAARSCRSSS